MVGFQIVSDLHLETPKSYDLFDIEARCPNLALLGDVGYLNQHKDDYLDFLRRHLLRFRVVFLVLGNHEPWHSNWAAAKETARGFESLIREERRGNPALGEFVLLDQTRYEFPGSPDSQGGHDENDADNDEEVVVLGCTLFSRVPADAMSTVSMGIQDFYLTDDWTVEQHDAEFGRDLAWLNAEIRRLEEEDPAAQKKKKKKKVVVFTHHSPTLDERAVDPRHRASPLQSGFASDLADQTCWRSGSVRLWAFGHTHYNCDYIDDDDDEGSGKRVLANQRGYYFNQLDGYGKGRVVRV